MKDLDYFGRHETDLEVMYWPRGKSEGQLLPLYLDATAEPLQAAGPENIDDAALAGLRETDPEAYRMVVYSWA
jgi:hypothetical protein